MTAEIISETQVEATRAAVRDWIERCGDSNAEIARIAGVDEKTVRQSRTAGWNPRTDTLSLFEKLLPPGWRIGDPIPPKAAATIVRSAAAASTSAEEAAR